VLFLLSPLLSPLQQSLSHNQLDMPVFFFRPNSSVNIIFVYNADSGRINALLDIGHKLLRPDTYSCKLCSLTHAVFSEKEAWKRYRESSGHELEFLHKDEFEEKYGKDNPEYTYPLILHIRRQGGSPEVLLSTEEINALSGLEDLISRLPEG